MNQVKLLKDVLGIVPFSKRIGIISKKKSNSVLIKDLLDRTFEASIGSEVSVVVGDAVIIVNNVVVGKTELESGPSVYVV